MAANPNPIYSRQGDIQWPATPITAASTAKDGTGATLIFTADATEGGYVRSISFKPFGTNVQTVARVFINNGGAVGTPANNALFREITLPAITNSETTAQADFEVALNIALPPTFRIYVALGTAVANGWLPTVVAGKY